MAIQKWLILDTANNVYVDNLEIKEGNATVVKRRLSGGLKDGVDVVEVNNGVLAFTVLLTRGMGIWRGKCGDIDLKWDSPMSGPVHPQFVPNTEPSGLGWLYGFDEWLVRCGLENNGSPQFDAQGRLEYPLHGRVSNIPASRAEISFDPDTQEFTIEGVVYESRLFSRKLELKTTYKTRIGNPSFSCQDVVTNLSAEQGSMQLLYHINTGQPFAGPGARVVVPYEKMAPRTPTAQVNLPSWNIMDPETPGSGEVVIFFDPVADQNGNTEVLLMNPTESQGILLKFNKKQLPYLSLWKTRLSNNDGYATGIEPAVNFPNERRFEESKGRVVPLAPGESKVFDLDFVFLQSGSEVAGAEKQIQQLQAKVAGQTVDPAAAGWGP